MGRDLGHGPMPEEQAARAPPVNAPKTNRASVGGPRVQRSKITPPRQPPPCPSPKGGDTGTLRINLN